MLISTDDSQQPKPGCEWYHPTTDSGLQASQLRSINRNIVVNEPSCLSKHIHHLGLEHGVDSLDTDSGTALGHSKHIHNLDGKVIHKLAQHQTHDFHGHTCATVSKHFEEGKRGNVHGFGIVDEVCVVLCLLRLAEL